jgi:hypothetical protein
MASEVKTNKVSPATSTTLNVGDSGDTLALAVDAVTGFNVGSDAAGDVLYNDGTDYTRLAKPGTPADEVLTFATGASAPSWAAAAAGGKTLKVYQAAKTDTTSITSTTFADITGITITTDAPASTGSRFLVFWTIEIGQPTGMLAYTRLERTPSGGSDVYPFIGDAASLRPRVQNNAGIWANGSMRLYAGTYLDSPASAVALTYTMQWCGSSATTIYLNRTDRDNDAATHDGRTPSSLVVMEIGA